MTFEQMAACGVLAVALGMFVATKVRHDIIAMVTLVLVAVLGLAPEDRLFAGFGHPAVLTVMSVLIISAALSRAGVVGVVARALGPYTQSPLAHMMLLTSSVALLSAFINNVGALALMMPVALATAAEHGRNPSIFLMPLAFAAILGGMTTLIGTPPNIVVANFRTDAVGAPFELFDFAPVGLAVALSGVAFVALVGWRLLPAQRQAADPQREIMTVGGYLTELRVTENSPLVNRPMREARLLFEQGASAFGLERDGRNIPAIGFTVLRAGDILLVRAAPAMLEKLIEEYRFELAKEQPREGFVLDEIEWKDASLLEAVISPASPLIGRNARVVDRAFGRNITLLALARQGAPIKGRLREQTFQAGDVAMLQGEATSLKEVTERFSLLPLAERGLRLEPMGSPWLALGIFVAAIIAGVAGVAPIGAAFFGAVVAYVLLGILPLRELYDRVDWTVIVLLGAMFPLGEALESTGATTLLAQSLVLASENIGAPGWVVMSVLLVATMFLSDIINNAATAVLMAPLAINIAHSLEANPDAFLMAVAVGASCAFLTPIGHQCNTLVMGPGGYRFGDYWRMGLPLEFVITLVAVPMILIVWPL